MVACIDNLPIVTQAIQGYLKDLQMSNILQQCFFRQNFSAVCWCLACTWHIWVACIYFKCIHGLIFLSIFSVEGSRKGEEPNELSLQTCVLHAMDSTGAGEDKQNHLLNACTSPAWFLFTCVETV